MSPESDTGGGEVDMDILNLVAGMCSSETIEPSQPDNRYSSIDLSIYLFIYLFIYLSIYLSTYLYIIYLSYLSFVCISLCFKKLWLWRLIIPPGKPASLYPINVVGQKTNLGRAQLGTKKAFLRVFNCLCKEV